MKTRASFFSSPAPSSRGLLVDFGHYACADGLAALANGESLLLLQCDRLDELHLEGNRIARHDHLGSRRQGHFARYVRGADVKLRLVPGEKRRMPAAFLLGQNINLGCEFSM